MIPFHHRRTEMTWEAAERDALSPQAEARALAAEALAAAPAERDVEAGRWLLRLLPDPAPEVRYAAALGLGERRTAEALDPLLAALTTEPDSLARQAVIIALGRLGERAVPALLEVLARGEAAARFQAVGALVALDPVAARAPLQTALADPDDEVRASAAAALGDLGNPADADRLAPLLEDPAPEVRGEAAMALVALGDRRATPTLLTQLRRRETRLAAAEALYRLDDPAALAELGRQASRWLAPPPLKAYAAAAAVRQGNAAGRAELLRQLGRSQVVARGLAIELLGDLARRGDGWAAEALQKFAGSPAAVGWEEELEQARSPR